MRRPASLLAALLVLAACGTRVEADPGRTTAAPPTSSATAPPATAPIAPAPAVSAPAPTFAAGASDPSRVPVLPADPRTVGQYLAAAETTIRSSADPDGPTVLAAARTQQVAYRIWAPHTDWDATLLAQLPDALRDAVWANVSARRALLALSAKTPAPDALPHWSIVAPAPLEDLLGFYEQAGAEFGVGWEYLAAINIVETTAGRIHGLSSSGARGPMQFMASTWAIAGEGDIDDPHDAIRAAAKWLTMRKFTTDLDYSLRSYNPSPYYGTAVKQIASVLRADPRAFAGYYHWDVYVRAAPGSVLLPVGWTGDGHTKASAYLATHPGRLLR